MLAGLALAGLLAAAPTLATATTAAATTRAARPADGTWTVQKSPNRTTSASVLQAVSCPAVNWCVAVGLTYNSGGATVTLAETWNGTSWTRQHTLNPSRSYQALTGVSCTSADFCEAVGSYTGPHGRDQLLGEVWNGRAWRMQNIPAPVHPANPINLELAGVSCVSATFCEAVGSFFQLNFQSNLLAEVWNGSSWAVQSTPDSGPGNALDGVSCVSATFCEAVGSKVALQWNGTSWALQTGPTGIVVSCAAADFCESTGYGDAVYMWNGSSWAPQTFPSSNNGDLSAVSCASADFCEATGYVVVGGTTETAIGALWNGTTWAQQPVPSHPGSGLSGLSGVSCSTASACETAGWWGAAAPNNNAAPQALTMGWDGTAWTIQGAPRVAADMGNRLDSVSCVRAKFCEAVGSSQGMSQLNFLAERWDGTSWRLQATPRSAPADGGSLQPSGVSCVSARFCEAVGATSVSRVPGAAVWNGTSWAAQTVPPGGGDEALSAVSCVSADFCMAVSADGGAYTWNGTAWSGPMATNPAGAYELSSVSCVSADFCEAVGDIENRITTGAEEWDGSTWTAQSVPIPSNTLSVSIPAVSCASVDACELTGNYYLRGVTWYLADGWNGSAWARQAIGTPGGTRHALLTGVSCVSADACTAVGYRTFVKPSVKRRVFLNVQQAAHWNGTTWTVNPVRSSFPNSALVGLSCTTPVACEAVGYGTVSSNYDSTWATLVEARS